MNNLFKKWGLISRYLAGECSAVEVREIEKWINEDPSRKEEIDYLQNMWSASDGLEINADAPDRDIESEWECLAEKMHALDVSKRRYKEKSAILHLKKTRNISHIGYCLRVAAAIILIFGAGVLLSQLLYQADTHPYTENRLFEFSTTKSQLAGAELLDGSKINLSVESSVRLSDDYYHSNRKVYLEGHAYFDVISDPSAPFIVQTSTAVIKALGTDFTVRAYPDDEREQVVVMNGIVSLSRKGLSDSSEILIYSGERALLDTATGEITKSGIHTGNYLEWMEGRIVFEENTLAEVTRELERWFGIAFVIQDELLRERKLTAVLDSKSLSNVLEVIGQTMNVNYHYEKQRVVIGNRS